MRRLLAITALSVALAAPAMAQDHQADPDKAVAGGGTLPTGWMARTDKGAAMTNVKFVDMAPGWHITLGPAAIFYRPADTASGNAHLVALLHMTPPKPMHPESFGMFIGGQDLQGAEPGLHLLPHPRRREVHDQAADGRQDHHASCAWTANEAVKAADAEGLSSNELSVQIKGGKVSFMANGKEVHSASAADVDTKGVVGVRINHNLSIHLEKLEVHRM